MMIKVGKPTGLIGYITANDEELERAGETPRDVWKHLFRFRTLMYTALWAAVGLALLVALFVRPDIELNISPVRNPDYVMQSDGTIRNAYDVRLLNKHGEVRSFQLSLTTDSESDIIITVQNIDGVIVTAPADDTYSLRVYLDAAKGEPIASMDRTKLRLWIEDMSNGDRAYVDTIFNGKNQ